MTKIFKISILLLIILLALLSGCSNDLTNNKGQMTREDALATIFDLSEVEKITVWHLVDGVGPEEHSGLGYVPAFEITDPADIEKMVEVVDFDSWKDPYGISLGSTDYYIQFDDVLFDLEIVDGDHQSPHVFGTIIDSIESVAKNGAGVFSADVDDFVTTSSGPYTMPYSIYTTLEEMIKKYKPEMLESR